MKNLMIFLLNHISIYRFNLIVSHNVTHIKYFSHIRIFSSRLFLFRFHKALSISPWIIPIYVALKKR